MRIIDLLFAVFKRCGLRSLVALSVIGLLTLWCTVLIWYLDHGGVLPRISVFPAPDPLFSLKSTLQQYHDTVPGLNYSYADDLFASIAGGAHIPSEPHYFRLGDLLNDWNPDDTSPLRWLGSSAHPTKGKGLVRFNFMDPQQRQEAFRYRDQEYPFVVYNVPDLNKAVEGTFHLNSLKQLLGEEHKMVEQILTKNKYMYYSTGGRNRKGREHKLKLTMLTYPDWQPPQEDIQMTFTDFLGEVVKAQQTPDRMYNAAYEGMEGYNMDPGPLYYYTISASEGKRTDWLRLALPFFDPTESLFMVDTRDYKGVNCRFGMKGIAAAAHYDGKRNFVAMLRGRKRYVLLPPSACEALKLFPLGHPSARHSQLDWSDPQTLIDDPHFYDAPATEIVLSMGEMLYIPSSWFHYIVSQDGNVQCNARSGKAPLVSEFAQSMAQCGFSH